MGPNLPLTPVAAGKREGRFDVFGALASPFPVWPRQNRHCRWKRYENPMRLRRLSWQFHTWVFPFHVLSGAPETSMVQKHAPFFIVFCLCGSSPAVAPFCARGARFGASAAQQARVFIISLRTVLGSVDSQNCCSRRVSMCNSCSNGGHRSVRFMELLLEACIIVQELYGLSPSVPSILRTVVRSAYRSATVVATEAIGVIHSWNCCSTLASMCKSCINGRHRCAPLTELLLDALYRCATLIAMGAIGVLQS